MWSAANQLTPSVERPQSQESPEAIPFRPHSRTPRIQLLRSECLDSASGPSGPGHASFRLTAELQARRELRRSIEATPQRCEYPRRQTDSAARELFAAEGRARG